MEDRQPTIEGCRHWDVEFDRMRRVGTDHLSTVGTTATTGDLEEPDVTRSSTRTGPGDDDRERAGDGDHARTQSGHEDPGPVRKRQAGALRELRRQRSREVSW